jgi:hypothetical protein
MNDGNNHFARPSATTRYRLAVLAMATAIVVISAFVAAAKYPAISTAPPQQGTIERIALSPTTMTVAGILIAMGSILLLPHWCHHLFPFPFPDRGDDDPKEIIGEIMFAAGLILLCFYGYYGGIQARERIKAQSLPQPAPDCTLRDANIEKFILDKANALKGHESCENRIYDTTNDLDDDKKRDLIIIFSVEGYPPSPAQARQYMLVYLSSRPRKPPLEIEVGSTGRSTVDRILQVQGNTIYLRNAVWQKGDLPCCPSGTSRSTYQLTHDKLEEETQKTK